MSVFHESTPLYVDLEQPTDKMTPGVYEVWAAVLCVLGGVFTSAAGYEIISLTKTEYVKLHAAQLAGIVIALSIVFYAVLLFVILFLRFRSEKKFKEELMMCDKELLSLRAEYKRLSDRVSKMETLVHAKEFAISGQKDEDIERALRRKAIEQESE